MLDEGIEGGERLRLGVRRDESCYVMEGDVKVTTPEGEAVEFGTGDLVTFPRGLTCTRQVRKPVSIEMLSDPAQKTIFIAITVVMAYVTGIINVSGSSLLFNHS